MRGSVLIVDDEPATEQLMRQVLRHPLRTGQLHLVFAANGHEAMTILADQPPFDVIMTDINMPGMDGLALLARIQAGWPNARTVVASAYFDDANVQKAKNNGADYILNKPIDITAFRDLLTNWLDKPAAQP